MEEKPLVAALSQQRTPNAREPLPLACTPQSSIKGLTKNISAKPQRSGWCMPVHCSPRTPQTVEHPWHSTLPQCLQQGLAIIGTASDAQPPKNLSCTKMSCRCDCQCWKCIAAASCTLVLGVIRAGSTTIAAKLFSAVVQRCRVERRLG